MGCLDRQNSIGTIDKQLCALLVDDHEARRYTVGRVRIFSVGYRARRTPHLFEIYDTITRSLLLGKCRSLFKKLPQQYIQIFQVRHRAALS